MTFEGLDRETFEVLDKQAASLFASLATENDSQERVSMLNGFVQSLEIEYALFAMSVMIQADKYMQCEASDTFESIQPLIPGALQVIAAKALTQEQAVVERERGYVVN